MGKIGDLRRLASSKIHHEFDDLRDVVGSPTLQVSGTQLFSFHDTTTVILRFGLPQTSGVRVTTWIFLNWTFQL